MSTPSPLTVSTIIQVPLERVWQCRTSPECIMKWAFASDTWEAPHAENDLRVGGTFVTTMAAKDKSAQFDFSGRYTSVEPQQSFAYTMDDGRKVSVAFEQVAEGVKVSETFDPETHNSLELQQSGWQAILDNFKKHVESHK